MQQNCEFSPYKSQAARDTHVHRSPECFKWNCTVKFTGHKIVTVDSQPPLGLGSFRHPSSFRRWFLNNFQAQRRRHRRLCTLCKFGYANVNRTTDSVACGRRGKFSPGINWKWVKSSFILISPGAFALQVFDLRVPITVALYYVSSATKRFQNG